MQPERSDDADKPAPLRRGRVRLLGVGDEADDGHARLTTGPGFVLQGGSRDGHARMQRIARDVIEEVRRRGLRLESITFEQYRRIVDFVAARLEDEPGAL